MAQGRITINVLGASITVSVAEDQNYLDSLLEIFQKEIEETKKATGLNDALKIAILAGFSLCDRAEKLKAEKMGSAVREQKKESDFREAESLTLKLISRLDEVLDGGGSGSAAGSGAENAAAGNGKEALYKLSNSIKNYPWGSPEWIPALLGEQNPSFAPWAELWMGVHPEGPSRCIDENGREVLLSSLIERDPVYFLGEETEKEFGTLPFLFKVLAADKPLSIQAHPNIEQAREGWERENREKIDLKAPERNYKDPNHKPEIICALGPFTAMCGFREPGEIITLLEIFSANAPARLRDSFDVLVSALKSRKADPIVSFVEEVFGMDMDTKTELTAYAISGKGGIEFPQHTKEWKLIFKLAKLYPGDPAMLAPLYLNLIELSAGEAIYLPSGVPHAYVEGLGIELMADSDNVLRGGLTPKHIDKKELFRVLKFRPYKPRILKNSAESACTYPVSCRDFSLTALRGGTVKYAASGPSIIIVNFGKLEISDGKKNFTLLKGESAFIPAGAAAKGLEFRGNYTAYAAGVAAPSL